MKQAESVADLVTIVVAPREKLAVLPGSLSSLFSSIPEQVKVVICMPELPTETRRKTQTLIDARGNCQLSEFECDLIPHKARALGLKMVTTPWVVFADNDLKYEPKWLDALASEMHSGDADVLAPLIYIGPPTKTIIHHAGGLLHVSSNPDVGLKVSETHRLAKTAIDKPGVMEKVLSDEFRNCEVGEFHCIAIRTDLLSKEIDLPEMLITREQQHLALQCRKHGLKVRFVHSAAVTYMALTPFARCDLAYHARRWSEQRARTSLEYLEETWNMSFQPEKVLISWIERQRRRPFREQSWFPLHRLPRKWEGILLRLIYGYPV